MSEVVIPLPQELVERIEELARQDERTRPAQIRYLLRLGLTFAEAEMEERKGKIEATR